MAIVSLNPTAELPSAPRWRGLLVLALVSAVLPFVLPNAWYFDVVIRIAIMAINAIALNILIGYTGQISLGHAGFFGIGAYGSGILMSRYGVPALLAMVLAATLTGVIAWGVARVILRLKGHYLAMATLGLGIIISIVITNETNWTGGPDGMAVDSLSLFGFTLSGERQWYWVFAVLLLLAVISAQNIIDSPLGRAMQAVHGSEVAAAVAGINVRSVKTTAFVLSAVVASLMGSLFAHYSGFINPGLAHFLQSVEVVTMVVLGGMASIWGAVIGAALLGVLPQFLAGYEGWDTVIYGLILSGMVIFMPRGIVPSLAARFVRKEG